MEREPIVTVAAVTSALVAVYQIVAAYVPELAAVSEQVNTLAAFAAPFVVAVISRRHTTPYDPTTEEDA